VKTKENMPPQGYTLITGASAGIGYELAKVFAEKGHDLVIIARNKEKLNALAEELEKTYPIKVKVISKDLTFAEERIALYKTLTDEKIEIETLVNNAGFGLGGAFSNQDETRQLEMIELNIAALTQLTRLFLPSMVARKRGYILNLASTAAFFPGPLMAIYYATKAYVTSFSVALSSELEETGVKVTALCPGPTRTEFQKTAHIENAKIGRMYIMEAKEVAEFGYRELHRGKVLAIPGIRNKLLTSTAVFTPRFLLAKTIKALNLNRTY
jgi:uncharacterized protein